MGMCKKVLMFGGAGTLSPVPPIVPGEERWTINNLIRLPNGPKRFKGATRHFDTHHKDHIVGRKHSNVWGWYQTLDIPVYLWQTYPDLPTSVAYPHEAVRAFHGGTRLFCSTLDWLVALALYEGFEEISLYAFRMGQPNYVHQTSSGRWWMKRCHELGVKVTHLSPSALKHISDECVAIPPRPDSTHLMYGLETTDRSKLYRGR
jgi:hypothetical protein